MFIGLTTFFLLWVFAKLFIGCMIPSRTFIFGYYKLSHPDLMGMQDGFEN